MARGAQPCTPRSMILRLAADCGVPICPTATTQPLSAVESVEYHRSCVEA
jgi:hypothetical protein